MSEAIETPYGWSSAFQPTRRDMANGPRSESCMPLAITSRLPPRSRNACRRASWAGLSESGVPATAITFTSGAILESVSANGWTV